MLDCLLHSYARFPRPTTFAGALLPTTLAVLAGLLWEPAAARALTVSLAVEFDTGTTGDFLTVEITESGGDLDFVISLAPELGPEADLHHFYLNLTEEVAGLAISQSNAPNTPYELLIDPSIRGGAGADFDFGVSFGNGAGQKGNGALQAATFTLTADDPLSISLLMETTWAMGGTLGIDMAAHVQDTRLIGGAQSETIGGVVPEPASGLLLASGLLGLGLGRRDRTPHRRSPA